MHKASFGTSEGSVGKEPDSLEAGRGCSCSVVSFFVDRNGTCRISPDLLGGIKCISPHYMQVSE